MDQSDLDACATSDNASITCFASTRLLEWANRSNMTNFFFFFFISQQIIFFCSIHYLLLCHGSFRPSRMGDIRRRLHTRHSHLCRPDTAILVSYQPDYWRERIDQVRLNVLFYISESFVFCSITFYFFMDQSDLHTCATSDDTDILDIGTSIDPTRHYSFRVNRTAGESGLVT